MNDSNHGIEDIMIPIDSKEAISHRFSTSFIASIQATLSSNVSAINNRLYLISLIAH